MQLVVCEAQYARINYSNFVFAPLPLLKIAPPISGDANQIAASQAEAQTIP